MKSLKFNKKVSLEIIIEILDFRTLFIIRTSMEIWFQFCPGNLQSEYMVQDLFCQGWEAMLKSRWFPIRKCQALRVTPVKKQGAKGEVFNLAKSVYKSLQQRSYWMLKYWKLSRGSCEKWNFYQAELIHSLCNNHTLPLQEANSTKIYEASTPCFNSEGTKIKKTWVLPWESGYVIG